jgi:hypothetical protein
LIIYYFSYLKELTYNKTSMQKKGPPVLYVGIFATDPSAASKTVRAVCKDALLETLKHILPHNYLAEGEHLPHYGDPHPL